MVRNVSDSTAGLQRENDKLRREVAKLRRDLAAALEREAGASSREAEALEQQKATSEILRVIAGSPTDLGAVLNAVAENSARLCECENVSIFRVEGDSVRRVARSEERRVGKEGGVRGGP